MQKSIVMANAFFAVKFWALTIRGLNIPNVNLLITNVYMPFFYILLYYQLECNNCCVKCLWKICRKNMSKWISIPTMEKELFSSLSNLIFKLNGQTILISQKQVFAQLSPCLNVVNCIITAELPTTLQRTKNPLLATW